MGPHGGGFVIDGVLFGFDSGAMGWLSEESRDPTRVFEVHRSSRVENGLQLVNGGSRDASYKVFAPIRGVLMVAAVQVVRRCQVRGVLREPVTFPSGLNVSRERQRNGELA